MPIPEKLNRSGFFDKDFSLIDTITLNYTLFEFIHSPATVEKVPDGKITVGQTEYHVSEAVLFRGEGFPHFIQMAEELKILPQTPDDKRALKYWRDKHRVYITIEWGKGKVSVSTVDAPWHTVTWENSSFFEDTQGDNQLLPKAARMGIIGYGVIPVDLLKPAASDGYLVGDKRDGKEKPWRVNIRAAILPNIDRALVRYLSEGFVAVSGAYLDAVSIENPEVFQAYMAKIHPVGVFADTK